MSVQSGTQRPVQNEQQALKLLRAMDFEWCVRLRDVWTNDATDIATLHGRLREEFQHKLQTMSVGRGSPSGWPIVGIGGTGKTHLLGALRRLTIDEGGAFVLVDMTDVRDFWDTVLQGYVDSLQEIVGEETQQSIILRRFLASYFKGPVERTLKALTTCSRDQLTGYVSKILRYLQRKKGQPAVKHQDAIRAICCLNSEDFDVQTVGLSWLQGQTLDEEWRQSLGFRVAHQSPRQTVMSLSWYLSLVGPTVTSFDQLDPIVHQVEFAPANGNREQSTAHGIVQRIAAGFADMRELHRTFPIIACVESTWNLLPQCAMSTSLDRFEPARLLGNVQTTSFAASLIEQRLNRATSSDGWKPPFPTWPFLPSALEEFSAETPRTILKKCDEHRRGMLADRTIRLVETFAKKSAKMRTTNPTPPKAPGQTGQQGSSKTPTENNVQPRSTGHGENALNDLDQRFDHLQTGVNFDSLLGHKSEDDRLAPLYLTAFDCLRTEKSHLLPDNVDAIIEHQFPGKANAQALHARLRLVFHDENSREEHYCVRGLEHTNALAFQSRLRAAMTTSGIDRELKFRHLVILRTKPVPNGKKTAELTQQFNDHGGTLYPISKSDVAHLEALRHMRDEQDPAFEEWLKSRKPVSKLNHLLNVLVPDSLFLRNDSKPPEPTPEPIDSTVPPNLPREPNKTDDNRIPTGTVPKDPIPQDPDVLLPLGHRAAVYGSAETVSMPAKVLAKHAIVLGGAGSGKTVTVRRIIEEAALAGIPSVIIDCAQDMCTFDEHRDEPSKYWNDEDPGKSRQFMETTRQVVYTPGKNSGRSLALDPVPDLIPLRDDEDALQTAVDMICGALRPMIASGTSQKAKNKTGVLAKSVKFFAQHAAPTTLANYIKLLDVLPAAAQLGISKEEDLAREMADSLKIQIAQNPLLQSTAPPLDPATLFGDDDSDDRTKLSAVSLVGLQSLEQQRSFINQLCMLLFSWIKKNPHPPNGRALRGLLVIDEARDFFPAVKASSCKDSMIRLAAQARKYKLGIVVATQHPKDIDTKIVGNCATQFFGRMVSPASLATANQMLQTLGVASPKLSKLETGRFYVNFPDGMLAEPALVQIPDSLTAGRLLTEEKILKKAKP